jgi:uncharacterized membrane protein YkoI
MVILMSGQSRKFVLSIALVACVLGLLVVLAGCSTNGRGGGADATSGGTSQGAPNNYSGNSDDYNSGYEDGLRDAANQRNNSGNGNGGGNGNGNGSSNDNSNQQNGNDAAPNATTTPNTTPNTTPEQTYSVSLDQAKQIAADHAKIAINELTFTKARLDYDDGVAEYEIEFIYGTTEYEYEVNATSGVITSVDIDSIYD